MWDVLPFAGLLLSIALFPLLAPHVWHRHYGKVAAAWTLSFAIPFVLRFRGDAVHEIVHVGLAEYLPFLVVLWGLFTIAGGIEIQGPLAGTPASNTAVLVGGALLASFVGTTGASMLLVRPLLRANAWRSHRAHVFVFFVFLVANVGGSLTPLGDPPLFLGFLLGVPFLWTLRLLPETAFLVGLLAACFYAVDRRAFRREPARPATPPPAAPLPMAGGLPLAGGIRVVGGWNLVLLAGVVVAVWVSGVWRPGEVRWLGVDLPVAGLVRDAAIVGLGAASLILTPQVLRDRNGFTWSPIREVAILFAGIFVTIVPATAILRAGEAGAMGPLLRAIALPWQAFWATGILSAFLDNAPTYVAMLHAQLGRFHPGLPTAEAVQLLLAGEPRYLEAVSAGAVFMGALTYIGNAPNFMVKAIVEEAGVAMPSFFGYVLRWSLPFLVPALLLVGWLLL